MVTNGTQPQRGDAEARGRARRADRDLAAGQLRDRPHGHAVRPVPVADRPGPAHRAPRRPAVRRRRRGQGGPLPRGDRGRLPAQADRPRHAHRPALAAPAPRAAGRSRRAGAERDRRRAGRDRRDPRPPPHRLDRDDGARAGDVRPGRLDRHAGRGALPPERVGAEPLDGDPAAVRDHVGHGHPQLADDDRARLGRRRVPAAGAGAGPDGARPRDVHRHVGPRGRAGRRDRRPRRQGVRGLLRADDRDRAGGDRRPGARRPPRGAPGGDARGAREARVRPLRADGDRHPGQGHRPLRVRRRRPAGGRVRHRGARRRDPAARRHEPQETGRTEGPRRAVKWVRSITCASESRRAARSRSLTSPSTT